MRKLIVLSTALLAGSAAADEVETLKAELRALKTAYEQRLQALEQRLQQVEPAPAVTARPDGPSASFNPNISVILDGVHYGDDRAGAGAELLEHVEGIHSALRHGAEAEHHHGLERGFNLRETELAFSATVDPYFDAALYLALESEGAVEVEEAYLTTRRLPAGFQLRAGKFLSHIGHANSQHPHQWQFTDQNLPYAQLLGDHGLSDTGLQLNYLAPTDFYLRLGLEALQGGHNELFGRLDAESEAVTAASLAAEEAGPRLTTAFAKFAPNLGDAHALQLGVFAAWAKQHQEVHHAGEADEHALEGDARLWGAEAVYQFDAPGSYGAGDWRLQAEYLRMEKDLYLTDHLAAPEAVGQAAESTADGFYLQAVYGIAPRWQLGVRYDTLGPGVNEVANADRVLADFGQSDRWTVAATWRPTEFSLLRFQYAAADLRVEGADESLNTWFIQYQQSFGAHGAHSF